MIFWIAADSCSSTSFAAAAARAVRLGRAGVAQRQQFLPHLGVEKIQIEILLMKFPDRFLVVEIMESSRRCHRAL